MMPIRALRMRNAASGAPPAGWQPSSLSSIRAWYVADDISGTNGSLVTAWNDREGNANASNAPATGNTLVTSGPNGHQSVLFSGGNTASLLIPTTFMAGETAGCYFGIVKRRIETPTGAINAGAFLDGFTGSASSSQFTWTDSIIYDGFGSTVRKTVGNPTPALAAWRIYSVHSASSDWRAYLDGTQLFSTATNTVDFGSGKSKYIGRSYANGNYFDGEVAEIIICNSALTTADRQKVEGYGAWKYGLQAQLPAGHPYLSAAP
jgi:hypothetical protein